jgi:hypothetical protein
VPLHRKPTSLLQIIMGHPCFFWNASKTCIAERKGKERERKRKGGVAADDSMMACPDSMASCAPFSLSCYFPLCSNDDDGDSAEWVEDVADEWRRKA